MQTGRPSNYYFVQSLSPKNVLPRSLATQNLCQTVQLDFIATSSFIPSFLHNFAYLKCD